MPVQVKEIMRQPPVLVREDDTVEQVARAMLEQQVTCVAVVDREGRIVGVVREEEFSVKDRPVPFSREKALQLFGHWVGADKVERDYAAARDRPAREIMVSGVALISEEARLSEALPTLQQGHSLIVVRGDRPVGMLARHDLLKLVAPGASDR